MGAFLKKEQAHLGLLVKSLHTTILGDLPACHCFACQCTNFGGTFTDIVLVHNKNQN